ncbi:hypothetical protein H1R20_g11503, partial [Candolleomyces eurysporus]
MALNLKRKRGEEGRSRKAPKLEEGYDISGSGSEADDSGDEVMQDLSGDEGEEEWGGVGDEVQPANSAHNELTSSKFKKPPTGEELRAIREATDLYRSSSFKLQIDALLPNIRPKFSRAPPLEKFLLKLHTFLMGLPSVEPQHPLDASRKLLSKGVSVPYCLPLPIEDTNWKVAFEAPDDITLVGSWPNKISVKPKDGQKYGVDVAVQMPDSLFQEKDYLNGRFFQKKAFYLAILANSIRNPKSGLNVDVHYESTSGDPRLTKLVLVPKPDGSQTDFTKLNARVCIIPTISTNSPIPLHRLSPAHANIRINSTKTSDEDTHSPTPTYNNALLTSFSPKPHLLSTYNAIHSIPAFADALSLLRLWANQRGFGEGSRLCVKGFESSGPLWSGLLELVIDGEEPSTSAASKRKPLGKGLSSYQLFKAVLDCLAKHDFTKHSALIKSTANHKFSVNEFKEHHSATLVDSSSLVNLVAYLPLGCLDLLRHEASKTLEILNSASLAVDPFTDVFLHDHRDAATRFDVIFQVDLSTAKARKSSLHQSLDFGSPTDYLLYNMNTILRKALGDRTRAVAFLQPSSTPSNPSTRPLTQAHPSTSSTIFIGLVLDPSHAFQLVQHGPPADSTDTAALDEFRELWGSKSEMRRFKDGRITESVVWDVKTADERSHVPAMVVRHILQWHFGLDESHVQTWQSDYDSIIRLPKEIAARYVQAAAGSGVGFKGAIKAFDELVKAVKALDDKLPLSLVSVSPVSESLRYTSTFNPVPLTPALAASLPPNARYSQPISIVFEFEKSAKWPDDLRAIQKIKLAFFESTAAGLMESVPGLKASVVLGSGDLKEASNELLDKAFLEIVTPEGWAFHARIWHDREATLLDRILDDKGPMPHIVVSKKRKQAERKGKEFLDAVEAKEVHERRYLHAPRHHRAIAALAHQYSAFSGTCRLVKRWFASHWLLGGHVSEEVVELLCAQFFVGDGKFVGSDAEIPASTLAVVPSTKERGFATVIRFLSEWKWEDGGLWVCLYGPRKEEEAEGEGASKPDPPKASTAGAWIVSTEVDQGGKIWSKGGPDAIVARRVRALAGATWKYLQTIEDGSFNVKGLFIHPTEDYDFLVQLNPAVLPRYVHNIAADEKLLRKGGKFANAVAKNQDQPKNQDQELVRPGFDPARSLFDDLQTTYSDTFRIFYDPYGGDMFGAVWDPTLKEPRSFRVLGGFSSVPTKEENGKAKDRGLVTLNDAVFKGHFDSL